MSTIKDVARKAGLSVTLVSRYLNGRPGVSETSRERIREAIRELNYRPNGLARSLVRQETQSIGIVLDNVCAPLSAPLIAGLERGAEEYDVENKYNLIFCSAGGRLERKQRQVEFLTQGRVDGIIIYGSLRSDDGIIAGLAASNFPFLLIENDAPEQNINKILIDNEGGAYCMTEYLIRQGHRNIVHVAGNMNLKITLDRMNGYVRAMQANGLPVNRKSIFYPDFDAEAPQRERESGFRGNMMYYRAGCEAARWMLSEKTLPDAVFFATDISAFGAIDTFSREGIRVPEDISVAGFDDERPADYNSAAQAITTVRQPLEQAGYEGIRALIQHLQTPELPPNIIRLSTQAVIRNSVKSKLCKTIH